MATRKTTKNSKPATKAAAKKTTPAKAKVATTRAKVAVAKTAASAASTAPAAKVVEEMKPDVSVVIKKPEMIDKIVARTGLKKKDVKPVVEATLEELVQLLGQGAELNLPPLGKVSINRTKDLAKATVRIVKVRTPKDDAAAKTPLANAAE